MFIPTNKVSCSPLNFSSPEFLIRSSFNLLGLHSHFGKLYFGGFCWFGFLWFVLFCFNYVQITVAASLGPILRIFL